MFGNFYLFIHFKRSMKKSLNFVEGYVTLLIIRLIFKFNDNEKIPINFNFLSLK